MGRPQLQLQRRQARSRLQALGMVRVVSYKPAGCAAQHTRSAGQRQLQQRLAVSVYYAQAPAVTDEAGLCRSVLGVSGVHASAAVDDKSSSVGVDVSTSSCTHSWL